MNESQANKTRNWLANAMTRSIESCSTEQDRLEIVAWLALVREVVADDSLTTVQKTKRLYALIDSWRTAKIFINGIVQSVKSYKDADLPLSLKVALPVTLGAAVVVGGQGAGIAALGGAVGLPVLLLIFLGSAGITSILEAFLGQSGARSYINVVLAMIIRDEVLRRANKTLRDAMSSAPAAPKRFDMPPEEKALRKALLEMDPYDFERHVVSFFQRDGLFGWVTQRSNDAGVDGFVRHPNGLILIQCKRYGAGNPIGRPAVQQFKGVIEENEAWRGYIVTTSRFTLDAINSAAQSEKVVLVDMDQLIEWHAKKSVINPNPHDLEAYVWQSDKALYIDPVENPLSEAAQRRLEELEMQRDKGFLSEKDFQKEKSSLFS